MPLAKFDGNLLSFKVSLKAFGLLFCGWCT